jgi:hypothetical protein
MLGFAIFMNIFAFLVCLVSAILNHKAENTGIVLIMFVCMAINVGALVINLSLL